MNKPKKTPRYTKKLHKDLEWCILNDSGYELRARECAAIVAMVDHLRRLLADEIGAPKAITLNALD